MTVPLPLKDFGEIPGRVANFKPYSTHFTNPIQNKLCPNTDGFEILACHLFCPTLTKEKNGLP